MGAFLPNYNDPIISILLLLGIIFIVSILSYGYSIWKQEQKQKELVGFLKSFESSEDTIFDIQNIEFEPSMKKPLFLLAHAFLKSGDYSKAINLYLFLIKHTKDSSILGHLAEAYYKAGFLQRSIDIYKEILFNTPRDVEILYKLELTYEQLRDFSSAKEVLGILNELGEDVSKLESYLALQHIKIDNKSKEDKFNELKNFLDNPKESRWVVLRELFKLNPYNAWSYYDDKEFKKLIDILWKLDIAHLNLDIISRHKSLKKLYYAKGLLQESSNEATLFAIDLISSAKSCGYLDSDLRFKYICSSCKSSMPLPFLRCHKCHKVYSMNIEVEVGEKREKSSYSLQ
jgi:tetratricopeptide (TPR) repeat protein